MTGLPYESLLDFDDFQWESIRDVVTEAAQVRVWSNDTEMLARILDQLVRIEARLASGVPVVQGKATQKMPDLEPQPRPDWWRAAAGEVVLSPGEAFRRLKG